MHCVKVQVCAWHEQVVKANVREEHRWPDLRTCLAEVLAALDFQVPDTIQSAALLVDRVTISFEFFPEVPRKLLVQAWCGAVNHLSEIVAVLPEPNPEAEAEAAHAQRLADRLIATGDQKVIRLLKQLGYESTKGVDHGQTK